LKFGSFNEKGNKMYMIPGISLLVGVGIGYALSKIGSGKRFAYLEHEAQAKAKTIEQEAALLLEKAKVEIQERQLEQKKEFDALNVGDRTAQ